MKINFNNQFQKWLTVVILCAVIFGAIEAWKGWIKNVKEINEILDEGEQKPEAHYKRMERFKSEAEVALAMECTNQIVGLSRIIEKHIADSDDDPDKWTASVTAEFVNHLGGIDRTNVPFTFSKHNDFDGVPHINCQYDWKKVSDDEARAFQHELERIRNGR